ncbi:hypothetical protein [Nostoc sp.]|uniref:hypothetical protein n=1 Tax=Nostoc sp. TaxID=1180 RepID=UPI002FF44DA7
MPLVPKQIPSEKLAEHLKQKLSGSANQPFSENFLLLTCLLSYLMTLVLLSQWGEEKFKEIAAKTGDCFEEWEYSLVQTFKHEVQKGTEYKEIFQMLDEQIKQQGEKLPKFTDLFSGSNEIFEIDLLFDIDGLSVEPTHLRSMDLTFHLKVPYPVRTYIDPNNHEEIDGLVKWINTLKEWLVNPTSKLPRPESNYIPSYTS